MRNEALLVAAAVLIGTQDGARPPVFEPYQPDLQAAATLSNAAADFDGDGDVDLFVGFNGAANRLYRNDGGTLKDVAAAAGVADPRATRAAAWGDFDADGDPDLLVGFVPGETPVLRLYRNEGARFQDVTPQVGLTVASGAVRQPVWIDFDGDGDLDLFVAFRDRANALYRNEGGRFEDIALSVGLDDSRKTVGAVWFDVDEDGDLDLYAANQDGDANALYRNDAGLFVDVAEASGVAWGGRAPREPSNGTVRPCAADVDGDGRFDIFAANYGPNGLFLNTGAGKFADSSAEWGTAIDGRYDTCAFGDFDNDGRIDVYVNGTVTAGVSHRDYLFRNAGTRFGDVTPAKLLALNASHGALWADFDADGDLDLALAGSSPDVLPLVWRNALARGSARRSVNVRVVDGASRATRAGAEVRAFTPGTRRLIAARLVDSGSGYNAQSDVPVHLGVGTADRVDIEVIFPYGRRRDPVVVPNGPTGRPQPVVIKVPGTAPAPVPLSIASRQPDVIFVPTRESVADEMLQLAAVNSNDVLYDLGSGDGRIVMLAAQKYGARAVGIEIDPKLVAVARDVAKQGEVEHRVTFINGDLFEANISAATVVMIYLSPTVNARLEPKLRKDLRPGTRIVSHQFPIGTWPPEKTVRAEDGTLLYLWTVPPASK
jgi:hypothetical protein